MLLNITCKIKHYSKIRTEEVEMKSPNHTLHKIPLYFLVGEGVCSVDSFSTIAFAALVMYIATGAVWQYG